MNTYPQTGKQMMQDVPTSVGGGMGQAPPAVPPMRSVTIGSLNNVPTGSRSEDMSRAVQGQGVAAALFGVALLPAIILCLMFGLSHRAQQIPASPVWAWAAPVIALFLVIRTAMLGAVRKTSLTGWILPFLLLVLLLAPAATVLYLRLTIHPVGTGLVVAQITLYVISLVVLLMASLSSATED
jgi:hypothetical protein